MEAVALFLQFVPLEGEVLDFFQPLTSQILNLLRGTNCLPIEPLPRPTSTTFTTLLDPSSLDHHMQEGVGEGEVVAVGWKQPSQCLYIKDDFIHEHIPQVLLVEALNLHYLHPSLLLYLNPSLRSQLGVMCLSVDHLKEVARVVLRCFRDARSDEADDDMSLSDYEDDEDGYHFSKGSKTRRVRVDKSRFIMVQWVAQWLACVHIVIEESTALARTGLLEKIHDLCILPLEDGSFVSAGEGNTLFFPPGNLNGMSKHSTVYDLINTL